MASNCFYGANHLFKVSSTERALCSLPEPVLTTADMEEVLMVARIHNNFWASFERVKTDGAYRVCVCFIFMRVGFIISSHHLREERFEHRLLFPLLVLPLLSLLSDLGPRREVVNLPFFSIRREDRRR
jgi:hypothetical protein